MYFHPRKAVPLGLLINEIATNAMKHGFTDDQEPWFSIDLKEDTSVRRVRGREGSTVGPPAASPAGLPAAAEQARHYILTLANSGRPFPEDIDCDNPEILGLRLIAALVDQLDGTMELKRKPHPVFTIRFMVKERS